MLEILFFKAQLLVDQCLEFVDRRKMVKHWENSPSAIGTVC